MNNPESTFKIYKDKKGEYRWRQIHRNGNILADSGEGYKRKSSLIRSLNRNIKRIQNNNFIIETDKK